MKFELRTATPYYNDSDALKLRALGFQFVVNEWAGDQNEISDKPVEVEINSIDELMEFSKKYGDLIIRDGGIIIYDGHIE